MRYPGCISLSEAASGAFNVVEYLYITGVFLLIVVRHLNVKTQTLMTRRSAIDILYSDILQQMRLSGASSDVDDALDDIVHDVQADYL
jgi:hypothetical protein